MPKYFPLLLSLLLTTATLTAQYQPLYKTIPNQKTVINRESDTVIDKGILIVRNISEPAYRYFRVKEDGVKRPCVIICPGGGYSIAAAGHEGTDVARYLNSIGINALVLKYRMPNDANQPDKTIAPLQDVQRAMYLARTNAAAWGIHAGKIGVMGFSAGAHLAASLATHYADVKIPMEQTVSLRPDFQVLLYPVISMTDIGHRGSRDNLLGKTPTETQIRYYSNEQQVNSVSPPAFIVHANDDKVVPVQNALIYYKALRDQKVEAKLLLFDKGGHGFGMQNPEEKVQWPEQMKIWLEMVLNR
ncbi:MAG: alpha/beta hydrolase [Chitinophagaceae bacterium]|nr:MAG: alpha/beta hydrolase [Chitinophagaceae bacterium]